MSGFFERVVPASRKAHWTRPDERVSARLADARLERRERAKRAKDLKSRTGDRRDV